jgi:hypothetical protein
MSLSVPATPRIYPPKPLLLEDINRGCGSTVKGDGWTSYGAPKALALVVKASMLVKSGKYVPVSVNFGTDNLGQRSMNIGVCKLHPNQYNITTLRSTVFVQKEAFQNPMTPAPLSLTTESPDRNGTLSSSYKSCLSQDLLKRCIQENMLKSSTGKKFPVALHAISWNPGFDSTPKIDPRCGHKMDVDNAPEQPAFRAQL